MGKHSVIGMKRTVLVMLGVLVLALTSYAQTTAASSTYRLQPEDVLTIQVYRLDQVNSVTPIGPDGNISAPFVGTVKAAGKTIKELEHDLTLLYQEKLKLKDPIVSVTIREYRKILASINGLAFRPGSYTMRPGDRILDLIAQGGGTSTDGRADLRRAYLIKRDNAERIPIDLNAMILHNDSTQNYVIEDGDQLVIPEEKNNRIIVNGRVRQPGPITYREEMRLSEVLAVAGELPHRSKMSKVQVFRRLPGQDKILAITANMVAFNTGKDPRQDITLQPGDFVYVPDSGNLDFDVINSISSLLFYLQRFNIDPFGITRR